MTVTTADSKYSRITLRGSPAGSISTFASRSRPLALTEGEVKASAFSVVFSSVAVADSFIADIVEVGEHSGQAGPESGLVAFHLLQCRLRGGGFGGFDGWTFTTRRSTIPL